MCGEDSTQKLSHGTIDLNVVLWGDTNVGKSVVESQVFTVLPHIYTTANHAS